MATLAYSDDRRAESSSLGRGLAILRAMNATRAYVSLHHLHSVTGIPKSSIVRLLKRFILDGYVAKVAKPGYYRLAAGIAELSRGLDPVWGAIDAVERQPALLADYKWPVAIGTRDAANLVVLFSTRQLDSPYSFKPSTVGRRPPLLALAMGTAYLAWCDEAERQRAISAIAGCAAPSAELLEEVEGVVKATRERGYGLRLGRKGEDTSVAVPLYGAVDELIGVLVETRFAIATLPQDIKAIARTLARTSGLIQEEIRSFSGPRGASSAALAARELQLAE